jgi:amidase
LVEEAIRRIDLVHPKVNAVIERMYDQARKTAASDLPDGPFRGVPLLVKDGLADCAGVASRKRMACLKQFAEAL